MENPCNRLVKLKLTECANVSLETLCSFHKKTTSLQLLRVDINDHFDSSSLVLLPSALAENQPLEGVTLRDRSESSTLIPSCARQLRLHAHKRLYSLNFGIQEDFIVNPALFRELEVTLCVSCTLQLLGLRGFRFEKDEMDHLVGGLLSSRSIASLSFQNCLFDSEAHTLFTSYLQTPATDNHSLCSLDLLATDFESPSALIIMTPHGNAAPIPTIRSCLRSLRLENIDDNEFFPVLVCNGKSAPIEFLRIGGIEDQSIHLTCIPQLTHLRDENHDTSVDALSKAVKQNGFLSDVCLHSTFQKVTMGNLVAWCMMSSKADHGRIERFRNRNRQMRILRENPQGWLGETNDKASQVSVIPTLCAVASQSKRRAAPSFLDFDS
jgi:hypothetical protein